MGILSDEELKGFDKREMVRHYRDGFCKDRAGCEYCSRLQMENEYWEEYEEMQIQELMRDLEDFDDFDNYEIHPTKSG